MQWLETVSAGEDWQYTLDGKQVTPKIMEDIRAPHPGIWVDDQRLYDTEWSVEGRRRGTIPPRSSESEAVYKAYETGDWSAVPRPTPVRPGPALEAAEEAVRDSTGWLAEVRWSHVFRIITIAHRNATTLVASLDRIERQSGPIEQLSLDQHLELDQRIFNLAASVDSIRDQILKGDVLDAYKGTEVRIDVRSHTKALWQLPALSFLQGLRNALVHKYQQGVGLDTIIGVPTRRIITLYPSRLLHVDLRTFEDPGKDYARAHEKVPLRELLDEVMTPLNQYSEWLTKCVDEHHAHDFDRLGELRAARDKAARQVDTHPVDHALKASLEGVTLSTPPPDAPRRP
ncbi:hypothetical protein O9K63_09100 [Janibacter cremeus]|uniref:hypothetical protein n=1 Tax=Janibacter cremeus TaxID=1285192 RepID=UPI0023F8EC89|nr:hypothetical protein [Janibacter cremeus]WEV76763.1 hypothetical protein O9K63_09100 [Janibacter cremeus]